MSETKILLLGDVVGPEAAKYLNKKLWNLRKNIGIDFVVANGENCAKGNGIDAENADLLLSGGCDILTTGNHVFKKIEAKNLLEDSKDILRPANYPSSAPGFGYAIKSTGKLTYLVINVLGTVMMDPLDNPIRTIENILKETSGKYDVSILDIHAEATSEKNAMGLYFDGKIDIIVGTHTHIQTADERILPNGTAYITDLGMCGPINSVLGVKPECIIEKLKTNMPVRFDISNNPIEARGLIVWLDANNKPTRADRLVF
ncbi:MAG: YmdB family metallophosphoesterase [Clostridia bacterium]|nr:YmdB family metallophosphoesterase [Clostridia bacterium]